MQAPRIVSSWRWFNVHSDHMLWKPAQSKVFHALIHYYTNADNRLVCITWLSGPIRAERTVMCITCSGWIWCFEECMSSVMLLQVQQLDGAEHIVPSRETPSPPQTETQSTQNGEGETPDRPHAISVVSLSVSSFLSISPVLIVQQHNWLHHVSEHHHCHIKHGWVCIRVSAVEHALLC